MAGDEETRHWAGIERLARLPDQQMVPALVRSGLEPSPALLERLAQYVARAGFDPTRHDRVGAESAGVEWRGRVLRAGDTLPTAERHYLKHVVVQQEWPEGTTYEQYLQAARAIVGGATTGIAAGRYAGRHQVSFVAETGAMKGPRGFDWATVEYDVVRGYWVTVYQLREGPDYVERGFRRSEVRWWRRPQAFRE